jgi:hypothetical protein
MLWAPLDDPHQPDACRRLPRLSASEIRRYHPGSHPQRHQIDLAGKSLSLPKSLFSGSVTWDGSANTSANGDLNGNGNGNVRIT